MSNPRAYNHEYCPQCNKKLKDEGEICTCLSCGQFDLKDLIMVEQGLMYKEDIMTIQEKSVFAKNLNLDLDDFLE